MHDSVKIDLPPLSTDVERFRAALHRNGLLIGTPTAGVYGRGPIFERVTDAVDAAVGRLADPEAEVMRFGPVMGRSALEATRYIANFPQLAGTVHCFCGRNEDHARLLECLAAGDDWTGRQQDSRIVLTPSSCYPVYGIIAERGPLPANGCIVDSASWCFRHEPSADPIRMLSFRQREQVCLGTEEQVLAFHDRWLVRARAMFDDFGLQTTYDTANDPFFGRIGQLMAQGQLSQRLKFEFQLPISDPNRLSACGSFNHHGDHFGRAFGLRTVEGVTARTACAGFGLERVALALFRRHGFHLGEWPASVQQALWPAP
jgi:seryl-tRNA synthetase